MGLISVITDSRESQWVKDLTFGGVPTSIQLLETGDLLLMTDDALIAVEHKEAADLLNSLRDGRLYPQLTRLRELTPWCYLVIVGFIWPGPSGTCVCEGREMGWNWASIQGALLTVQELGISVVNVKHASDFEAAIVRLTERDRKALRVQAPRDITIVTEAERILTSFPGIGADRVRSILDFTHSVGWALTWLTHDREDGSVPGVGLGTKRKVRKALGLEDDQELCVILKDTGMPPDPAVVAAQQKTNGAKEETGALPW